MASKIQIKRGLKEKLPNLEVGEPAFTTDTKQFFIGTDSGNIEFAKNGDLIYKLAGGTATAITLEVQELVDGYSKTFIASDNNGVAETTINGKPLYRPNTKAVPNLIKGKAYTVWYDKTGDCFFIKASAEGNTIAAHVLAGDTFSNDSDTGISGTMTNNGAAIITPGTTNKAIQAGYHNGNGYVAGDSKLISDNIKAGTNIFGVQGKSTVVDTAGANLAAGYMLAGASGYANGSLIGGSIPNHSGADSPANSIAGTGPGRIYVRPQWGYYDGNVASYVDDGNFRPENIVSGKTIFGVTGNASIQSLGGRNYKSGNFTVPSLITGGWSTNISLDFSPIFVGIGAVKTIYGDTFTQNSAIWIPGLRNNSATMYSSSDGSSAGSISVNNSNQVYASILYNGSGKTYHWFAIG